MALPDIHRLIKNGINNGEVKLLGVRKSGRITISHHKRDDSGKMTRKRSFTGNPTCAFATKVISSINVSDMLEA